MSIENVLTIYQALSDEEKTIIRNSFNRSIVDMGNCNSVNAVEDDYNSNDGNYYIYRSKFTLWLSAYFYFHENSLEGLLERSKSVLSTEGMEREDTPVGVTVDRSGYCYCLRTIDGISLRTSNLLELKHQWNSNLKVSESN